MNADELLKENYLMDIGWSKEQLEVLSKDDLQMVYDLTSMTMVDLLSFVNEL